MSLPRSLRLSTTLSVVFAASGCVEPQADRPWSTKEQSLVNVSEPAAPAKTPAAPPAATTTAPIETATRTTPEPEATPTQPVERPSTVPIIPAKGTPKR